MAGKKRGWKKNLMIGGIGCVSLVVIGGLFVGVELVRDRRTLEPAADEASYVVERMKRHGVLLSTDGPLRNVLKIKPPMVFGDEEVTTLVRALDRVLGEDYPTESA